MRAEKWPRGSSVCQKSGNMAAIRALKRTFGSCIRGMKLGPPLATSPTNEESRIIGQTSAVCTIVAAPRVRECVVAVVTAVLLLLPLSLF